MKKSIAVLLCFLSHLASAQEDVKADSLKAPLIIDRLFDTADRMVEMVSGKTWTFIPAVTYSPETSLGLGARAIKIFRHQERLRPSTLPITFLYTLNRQMIFTTALDLWSNGNKDHWNTRLELKDYPFKFYGIGNDVETVHEEAYATRSAELHLSFQKMIAPGIYIGPQYRFNTADIYSKEIGGLLASGQVAGSQGSRVSGLGLLFGLDTRNNIFKPLRGSFHQASLMSYQSFLGSNFNFNQYQVDLRKYMQIHDGQVLAVQAWYSFTTGHPPFQHISLIGGSDLMRGYFEGRYRDRNAMVYQAEYRVPVYRKLGLVLFGSAGQVAEKLASYSLAGFRYGGGIGVRYKLTEDGLNFRFDLAFGDQPAFYFGLNEVL